MGEAQDLRGSRCNGLRELVVCAEADPGIGELLLQPYRPGNINISFIKTNKGRIITGFHMCTDVFRAEEAEADCGQVTRHHVAVPRFGETQCDVGFMTLKAYRSHVGGDLDIETRELDAKRCEPRPEKLGSKSVGH